MERQTLAALIILAAVILLYATEKIPLALTAIFSMLAVYFGGILSFGEAFSGFSNNTFIMVIGMSVFGSAFAATGLIDLVVQGLEKLFLSRQNFSEKQFILLSGVLSAVLSMFLNPMLVTTIFMSIIDAVASAPGSKITRRNTTFPVAAASVYGAMFTSVSLSTVILTSSLLEQSSVGRPFYFLEPAVIGLPCFIMFLIFYATIGEPLQKLSFRFDDTLPSDKAAAASDSSSPEKGPGSRHTAGKRRITLVTLVICIFLFIFSRFSFGAVAFTGAAILMLTGCVDMKAAFKEVNWPTAVLLASSIGFAKAVDVSGAGQLIADALVRLSGPLATTPFGVCLLALIISSLLSNFMSNSSTALILVPIFILVAEECGAPILPVVIASGVGAGLATATPVCTGHITLTASVGYRFFDYVKVGGALNLLAVAVSALSIYLVYLR